MPRIPRLAAIVFLLSAASATAADVLPFKGSYGNEDGCLYARTGVTTGKGDLFLLTPEGVKTSVSYCDFEQVMPSVSQTYAVRAACQGEGVTDKVPLDINVEADGLDAYSLTLDDGTTWGPLTLCR